MPIFEVDVAEEVLEGLIECAKSGEEILIREGEDLVRLEPILDENTLRES